MSVLNGSFQVLCTSTASIEITSIEWLVNGQPLENLNLDARTDFDMDLGIGWLIFDNVQSKHNNSNIRCKVTTGNSEILTSIQALVLTIQG